jgi:hypothetical protein
MTSIQVRVMQEIGVLAERNHIADLVPADAFYGSQYKYNANAERAIRNFEN